MWTTLFLFIFWLVQCNVCTETQVALPISGCYRDDNNLNNCLLQTTELLRPYLKKGIPELELPPLSAYSIPNITFENYDEHANYIVIFNNVTLSGLDRYDFTSVSFDVAKLKLVASFNIDHLNLEATFISNGKVFGAPVEGDGPVSLNITRSDGTIKQLLSLTSRNGVPYLEPLIDLTKINLGNFSYRYKGLYDDSPLLAKAAARALHEYEPQWMPHFKTVIAEEIIKIIRDVLLGKLYKAVPYDKLLPSHK